MDNTQAEVEYIHGKLDEVLEVQSASMPTGVDVSGGSGKKSCIDKKRLLPDDAGVTMQEKSDFDVSLCYRATETYSE